MAIMGKAEFVRRHQEMGYLELAIKYAEYVHNHANVGDGMTVIDGMSAKAYTIVKKLPNGNLVLQRDKATRNPNPPSILEKTYSPYLYKRQLFGEKIVASWSEKKQGYYTKTRQMVIAGRHESFRF